MQNARLERVAVHLEHELDVAAGDARARGEEVHQEGAVVAPGREVGGDERLVVRKADVGRSEERVGILRVHLAAQSARGATLRNRARLLHGGPQPGERHVKVAGRDGLALLLRGEGVLHALQAELDRGHGRLGVVVLPLVRPLLGVKLHELRLLCVVDLLGEPRSRALVPLLDHAVRLHLLASDVAQRLAHREHLALAVLVRLLHVAVRAPLDDRLLRDALVDAVVGEHVRLQHRARQTLLVRVGRVLHAVEERDDGVAVLLERGEPALLRLLEDGARVLVRLPEDAQQALLRLDVAVHPIGQRRVEDVRGAARVVHDVAPAVVDDVLRRAEVVLVVVPVVGVDQTRVQRDRLAALVERARDRHVHAGVALRGRHVPLVVVRDRRADWVLAAVLLPRVHAKRVGRAPGRRVLGNVRVVRPSLLPVALSAHAVQELDPVLHTADALVLRPGRRLQILVRDLGALQLVLPLQLWIALLLRAAVDLARRADLGVLLHDLAHELVRREALVEDEHEDLEADVLAVHVVHGHVHEAEHHRGLLRLGRVGVVGIRAVRVRLDLAVPLLPELRQVIVVLLLGQRQLRVVVRRDEPLGHADAQHAHERAGGNRARTRPELGLRAHVGDALRVGRLLPRRDEAHVQDASGATLAARERALALPLQPVPRQAGLERGRLRVDAVAHDQLVPPGHVFEPLVQPLGVRGARVVAQDRRVERVIVSVRHRVDLAAEWLPTVAASRPRPLVARVVELLIVGHGPLPAAARWALRSGEGRRRAATRGVPRRRHRQLVPAVNRLRLLRTPHEVALQLHRPLRLHLGLNVQLVVGHPNPPVIPVPARPGRAPTGAPV